MSCLVSSISDAQRNGRCNLLDLRRRDLSELPDQSVFGNRLDLKRILSPLLLA